MDQKSSTAANAIQVGCAESVQFSTAHECANKGIVYALLWLGVLASIASLTISVEAMTMAHNHDKEISSVTLAADNCMTKDEAMDLFLYRWRRDEAIKEEVTRVAPFYP